MLGYAVEALVALYTAMFEGSEEGEYAAEGFASVSETIGGHIESARSDLFPQIRAEFHVQYQTVDFALGLAKHWTHIRGEGDNAGQEALAKNRRNNRTLYQLIETHAQLESMQALATLLAKRASGKYRRVLTLFRTLREFDTAELWWRTATAFDTVRHFTHDFTAKLRGRSRAHLRAPSRPHSTSA